MSNLALDLRPTEIGQLIGQDNLKRAVTSFAEKDNWPNVFLLYGPPGTGKTTSALIIAKMAGAEGDGLHEINASSENGVDAARSWAEMSASAPFTCKRRVIILNEFHQVTVPAQNALKDPMEKNPTIWILTTDRPDKVEGAIKSRAAAATFELKNLSKFEIERLVTQSGVQVDIGVVSQYLLTHGVSSPREILGILDQVTAGVPLEQAVHGSEHEPLYKDVCGSVLRGDWVKASGFLSQIKTADSRGLTSVLSAFLRSEILKNPIGLRADALSACLVGVDQTGFQDGTAYGAVVGLLYKTCKALGAK